MRVLIKNQKKVNKFSTIFKNINEILANVKLYFTADKLYAQGMDLTQSCLFEINILGDWFDEYIIHKDITVGLPCTLMYKLLSCLEENQEILMYMDDKKDKLYIDFENDKKYKKTFELPLLDLDYDMVEIPLSEYDCDININTNEFVKLINQLKLFGKNVNINCTPYGIKLQGYGEFGKMKVEIQEKDIIKYAYSEDIDIKQEYNLDFIDKMCKFEKISDEIFIHFDNNKPMVIIYPIEKITEEEEVEDMEQLLERSYLRLILAPKVDD